MLTSNGGCVNLCLLLMGNVVGFERSLILHVILPLHSTDSQISHKMAEPGDNYGQAKSGIIRCVHTSRETYPKSPFKKFGEFFL